MEINILTFVCLAVLTSIIYADGTKQFHVHQFKVIRNLNIIIILYLNLVVDYRQIGLRHVNTVAPILCSLRVSIRIWSRRKCNR